MTEHTSGPWEIQTLQKDIHGYPGWNSYCIRSPQNCHLATVGDIDRYHEKQAEANARLIAAAPDLLAALKWVADEIKWGHDMTASLAVIEQAILKAKGDE